MWIKTLYRSWASCGTKVFLVFAHWPLESVVWEQTLHVWGPDEGLTIGRTVGNLTNHRWSHQIRRKTFLNLFAGPFKGCQKRVSIHHPLGFVNGTPWNVLVEKSDPNLSVAKVIETNQIQVTATVQQNLHRKKRVSNWGSKHPKMSRKRIFLCWQEFSSITITPTASVQSGHGKLLSSRCEHRGYFSLAASHWPCLSHLDLSHNGRLEPFWWPPGWFGDLTPTNYKWGL